MSEKTKNWMAEVMASPEYLAATISHDLILQCEKRREELSLSYAEIARRMDVSRQHVTKMFTGTQNSTIGSLVKLALVLDCNLEIGISAQLQNHTRKQRLDAVGKAIQLAKKRVAGHTQKTTQKAQTTAKAKTKKQAKSSPTRKPTVTSPSS